MKTTQSEKILLKKFKYAEREGFVLNGYGFYYSSGRNSTIDQEKFLNNGELRHSEEKKSIPSKEEKHSPKSVKAADQHECAEKWARILIEQLEEKNTPATFKLCTFNKLFQQCKNEMQVD